MSFKLYKLKTGSMRRKVVGGGSQSYGPGTLLVPSPSEFEVNKMRLEQAGDIEDDSPEVEQAILNTNKLDHPDFGKPKVPVIPSDVKDIRDVKDAVEARSVINATATEAKLDEFLKQELDNKPRVRRFIVQSIETRRAELKAVATA